MQNTEQSLENLEYFKKTTLENITNYNDILKGSEVRIEEISKELITLGEVKKLLIQLKNSKMFEKKDFILNTINTALSDVFIDQNVKIDLVASNTNQEASKLNIKYDIVLYQNGVEMARNEKMLNQNGGGVLSFISILFKILVGFIYSRNRFYVFDESLAEVSEVYLPRMGQFLQKFCKVHNFIIILITHTPVISEYADLCYKLDGEFENGVPTLKIESIEGDYPEENYVYSKIENFQSIKKLEFRYKGFTTIIGKNNIGKSASFRAINSIIFNNFDIKAFPRFESSDKPDKLLNTRLEFGYFHTKDNPKNEVTKIGFYKKGQGIIWFFDGMEFVGKNLAIEKVKEKVESIGFKYLKLKEQYKNFKGNLKDQTERLAITTQQDDYYLIGGKTSETSKVFDFLFDSREVTLALIKLNDDIKNLEVELNNIIQQNGEIKFQLSRLQIELKKWDIEFKIALINKLNQLTVVIDFNKKELNSLINEFNLISQILIISDLLWRIEAIKITNLNLQNKILWNSNKINILDKLLTNIDKKILVENVLYLIYSNNSLKLKLNINNKYLKIVNLNEVIQIQNYVNKINSKFQYFRTKFIIFDKLITNLSNRILLENYITLKDNIIKKKNEYEINFKKSNILSSILEKLKIKNTGSEILNEINKIKDYIFKINKSIHFNQKCLEFYNKSIIKETLKENLLLIKSELSNLELRKKQIQDLQITIKELPNHFKLTPCRNCSTLGFICEGHL